MSAMQAPEPSLSDWKQIRHSYWQMVMTIRTAMQHVETEGPLLVLEDRSRGLLRDIHAEWVSLQDILGKKETWDDIRERGILLPHSLRSQYDQLDLLYEQLTEGISKVSGLDNSQHRQIRKFLMKAGKLARKLDSVIGDRKDEYDDADAVD
ncbi:hypothetical protein QFC20_005625 [Naganishia adeliensis]|uniref:Uncharacterized protein n=1 Tax=Naganishia adeliensis TaxID=92952 RepID=A0ACC2VKU5_9TREE|nr:hypothetical protein QFC20_005625 [Naganishia adeliensis]